MTKPVNH